MPLALEKLHDQGRIGPATRLVVGLDGSRDCITATVKAGIVTFEGRVEYTSQRLDAARSIANLLGVHGVIDNDRAPTLR